MKKYSMGFTTASFLHQESIALANLFNVLGDWKLVREHVITHNTLQARTNNTLLKICGEIVSRLQKLTPQEIKFLIDASSQDQAYLLWIAICRRYSFIADFAVEVLCERYLTLRHTLGLEDFEVFFNQKSDWHDELLRISESTRYKLRQVLFKMLRDAGFLTKDNNINMAILSPSLARLIWNSNPQDLRYLPIFESDLKDLVK